VSLYTSVYWTKRVFVVVGLLLFLCSGIRIFQFVSSKLTTTTVVQSPPKAELGYGDLDRLTITSPLKIPSGFNPTDFRIGTLTGKLDVDNGYPLENTQVPLANVYKIIEKPFDLNSTEIPKQIAKNLNFTVEQITDGVWKEDDRELQINGQYLLINYKNNKLKTAAAVSSGTPAPVRDVDTAKRLFESTLKDMGITPNLTNYKFDYQFVDYDATKDIFTPTGTPSGKFIKVSAKRFYSNLSKNNNSTTTAVYPDFTFTNNYIIIPSTLPQNYKTPQVLTALSFYNWPLDTDGAATNKNAQTYYLKSPKQAYQELTTTKKYLMSVRKWNTYGYIDPSELSGIDRLVLFTIRLEMYEDTVNTDFIQPVYVFTFQAEKNGQLIELVYYVPALLNTIE
jgi:hypothetical protein